jgi:hypothetical protein
MPIPNPKSRVPKDQELWEWAWTNFGSSWSVAVREYNKAYFEKYTKKNGFNKEK